MLKARAVAFQYPNNHRGLSPVSLDLLPGEFNLITGPSGSGKSTLARCFTGVIPHLYHGTYTGEVRLDGTPLAELPMWRLAEKIGMVFQNPSAQMLAPTVEDEIIFGLENLGLGRSEIEERLDRVLAQFDLSSLRNRSPLTLSGGEQQKLALAAVIARHPQVLVLDEPLSMLDTNGAYDLINYLVSIAKSGVVVSIFEHRQEYLAHIDDLKVLSLNGIPKPATPGDSTLILPQAPEFALEIQGLEVMIAGRKIIQGLDLSLAGGQLVAIVGKNGVGKTTLLRAIAGLQEHRGIVRIASLLGVENPDLGMVFQNPDLQLFNPSVKDEILYRINNPDMVYYEELVRSLGLKPYENTPPLLLSEGEKKRLALALVLMRKPSHGILLDEPSLGQDKDHKVILNRVLRSLTDSGRLVVITTHDITLASKADRLILLGPSGVIADGETKQLLIDSNIWDRAGMRLPAWFLQNIEDWE